MAQPTLLTRQAAFPPVLRFGVVASEYNSEFVESLIQSALKQLTQAEPQPEVELLRVPGAFEIPLVTKILAHRGRLDAIIALGVIIRGETAHADLIGSAITQELLKISVEFSLPIIHEVLLVNDEEQARQRVIGGEFNRGKEAGRAAIAMVRVIQSIQL